ncbi:hypothetical protein PLESTF_001026400 [Pleodorina starrii]|nr:hypothetical protein PLESTF_001026400 [Pleodorina starrii]
MQTVHRAHELLRRELRGLRYGTCRHGRIQRTAMSTKDHSSVAVGSSSSDTALLAEVVDQLKTMNSRLGKISKQVQRLETRVCELYEFTSLPLISSHFNSDFAESVDLRSAAHIVDHILGLALNLDLPALKQRGTLISILEDYVLKERQGLRAAMKSLMDEACEDMGVCMVALPSNFQTAPWDDIRACLQELQLGFSSPNSSQVDERINNLMRCVDALETGSPPRPLPGFIEMATAMASGCCSSRISLDCRGRIDVRDTYIEFHIGAFKGVNSGYPETCLLLKRSASLFVWAYRVLEPHIYKPAAAASPASSSPAAAAAAALPGSVSASASGRRERDVEAIGYTFSVGKVPPQDSLLKLYDDFEVEVNGRRSQADIAYRYFSVKPTGLHEHYAKV